MFKTELVAVRGKRLDLFSSAHGLRFMKFKAYESKPVSPPILGSQIILSVSPLEICRPVVFFASGDRPAVRITHRGPGSLDDIGYVFCVLEQVDGGESMSLVFFFVVVVATIVEYDPGEVDAASVALVDPRERLNGR